MNISLEPSRPAPAFEGGFSILMAVYGGDDPRLFRLALDSVYANTLLPDEFILVVDGPVPPALAETIGQFEEGRGMKVVRLPENRGLALALNAGLEVASHRWIVRADADDINLPDRFARQAQLTADHPEVGVMGGAILELEKDGTPVAFRRTPGSHEEIRRFLLRRSPFNHMTVAYTRTLALEAGGYPDLHLKEDYGLWCKFMAMGARFANTPEILVHATAGRDMYRRRGGWRYAKAELDLQALMHRLGLKSRLRCLLDGTGRAVVYLLPNAVRGFIYERWMRQPLPAGAGEASPDR